MAENKSLARAVISTPLGGREICAQIVVILVIK